MEYYSEVDILTWKFFSDTWMSLIINEFVTVESSAHIKQNRDTLVLGTQTQ